MIGVILDHHYQIAELIGTGGMAEVYRAVHLHTKRSVAIKVLKAEFRDNAEFLRRFEREARAVLHLSHENIVHAYGVGEYNGMPYIVLEYVEGRTLKEIIQERGAMPQKTAINICSQILSALATAHAAGIIHRDVKPQNVIIMPNGKAKLTDFGIARDAQATTVTFAGSTVLGSAHYLSPEQAKGRNVMEESDLYSVGIMLYEMLTGDVPFQGESTVAVALKQINEAPMPPIELNPQIYPSVNEVVLCALQKDASARFSSAEKMQYALRRAYKDPNSHPAQRQEQLQNTREIRMDDGYDTVTREQSLRTIWKIAILLGIFIFAFIGTFFGIRSTFKQQDNVLPLVPALTNRSLAEAEIKAESYGFIVTVGEYQPSSSVEHGKIISQTPSAGSALKLGSTITVTVSAGADVPSVPLLKGLTIEEAAAALSAVGLEIGSVSYQVSDIAIGYVCAQTPSEGTELAKGSRVDVCVSATTASTTKMPAVKGLALANALELIDTLGFRNVLVRYNNRDSEAAGTVLHQQPATEESIQPGMRITLDVDGTAKNGYFSDVAYNLTVQESGTAVMVTMMDEISGITHERILYEGTLEKGEKVPLSFTATASSGGIHELILYINGIEVRRQDTGFEKVE